MFEFVSSTDLDAGEARRRQEAGGLVLDVREPYEWAAYHVPGALNVPLGQLSFHLDDMPSDRELLVVCASGSRSQVATGLLRRAGYSRAFNVVGGMMGWLTRGLPVEEPDQQAQQTGGADVLSIRTPGLGDSTYLLTYGGVSLVVDPQRDVERFLQAAERAGTRVRYVLETHVHNDYVSGGRELARETGAELIVPAGAGVAYEHVPAFHLEDLEGDRLLIRPIHTPGHTPEHMSYLVFADGQPSALFSGGSLLIGSAGRPDLLGKERARQLAYAQYHSLQRLATLPDELRLYPTHGEGSFCAAGGAGKTTSTIGFEKRTNPMLAQRDRVAFAEAQIAGLQPYPRYYAFMGPINTLGPTPLPACQVAEWTAEQVATRDDQVLVVDARPRAAFAAGHVEGALGVELADDFGTWVGWLAPFNAPLVLVLDADQDLDEAVVQLGRIGFDDVRGVMRGMESWRQAGYPVTAYETVSADTLAEAVQAKTAQVLDVRAPAEHASGSLPGAVHRYVPDLVGSAPVELDPSQPVWVVCASGFRASIAAGLLQWHGYRPIALAEGGVPDVQRRLAAVAAA